MVKSRYFCDRCNEEVTDKGASFALYEVRVARPNDNPLVKQVCRGCVEDVSVLLDSATLDKAVTR